MFCAILGLPLVRRSVSKVLNARACMSKPSHIPEQDPQMFLKDHSDVYFLRVKCLKPMLKIKLMSRVIGTFFVYDPNYLGLLMPTSVPR